MENNKTNIDETENINKASDDNYQNVESNEITTTLTTNTDDEKAKEYVDLQNENNTHGHKFVNTNIKQEKNKNEIDLEVNVSGYLKSEISGLDAFKMDYSKDMKSVRLPPYRERNFSFRSLQRYANKPTKACVYIGGKIRNAYTQGTLSVYCHIMGSERIPGDKDAVFYEPETQNKFVQAMLAVHCLLHVVTAIITMTFLHTFNRAHNPPDIYDFGLGMALVLILVISVSCFQYMRFDVIVIVNCILAVIFVGFLCSVVGSIFDTRILVFMNAAIALTDVVLFCMGFKEYDFTINRLYCVALVTSIIAVSMVVPMTEVVGRKFYGYKRRSLDHIGTYLLCYLLTLGYMSMIILELHLLLSGDSVLLAEGDYFFGALLMFLSPIDYLIRACRLRGCCNRCEPGADVD